MSETKNPEISSIALKDLEISADLYTASQIDAKLKKCLKFDENYNVDARSQNSISSPLYGVEGGNVAEGINTGIGAKGFSIISGDISAHTLHIYENFEEYPEISSYIGKHICYRISANHNMYSKVINILTAENKLVVDTWPSNDNEQTLLFGRHERYIKKEDGSYQMDINGNILMFLNNNQYQPEDIKIIQYKWLFCPDYPSVGANITLNAIANHVEGYNNHCYTAYSHAEGRNNKSYGQYSHTEGYKTSAGYAAHAGGYQVSARGDGSFGHGKNAFAQHNGSFVWSVSTDVYASHGINTFNINPINGIEGLYIGNQSLHTILNNIQTNLQNRIQSLEGLVEKTFAGNIFILNNGKKEYEEIAPGTINYVGNSQIKDSLAKIQKLSPNITNLSANAFNGFKSLTDANLVGVTEFGDQAFGYCDALSNVVLDNNLTHTGTNTFRNATKLSTITLPDGCLSIENGCFYQSGLIKINIPETVTYIDKNSFASCRKLSSITIPGSVEVLSDRVFDGASGLKNITFNAGSNIQVGNACFQGTNLTSINVDENHPTLSSYDNKMLLEKTGMKLIHIIDEEETRIPEGVQTFKNSICYGQKTRKRVIIPSTLTSNIAQFYENSNLTSYTVNEQNQVFKHSDDKSCILSKDGTKLYRANNAITSIPSSCLSIESNSFSHLNYPSKSIVIPQTVQLIRGNAFAGGQGTELVIIENPNIELQTNTFSNSSPKITIKFKNLDLSNIAGANDNEKAKNFITSKKYYQNWKNTNQMKIQWESLSGSSGEFDYKS